MHDSMMPISGAGQMFDMMINAFYGGVGVGYLNFYVFIIIAVFISGLMVGRTPEFMGRKIEAREMKIASLVALLHPFMILVTTAIASYILVNFPGIAWAEKPSAWLNNPGFHGFSEMLYQFTSSSANNGSGYEGLADNSIFWNVSAGFVMFHRQVFTYHRTGSHSRYFGQQKVCARVGRDFKNRYRHFRHHDIRGHYHSGSFIVLPGVNIRGPLPNIFHLNKPHQ